MGFFLLIFFLLVIIYKSLDIKNIFTAIFTSKLEEEAVEDCEKFSLEFVDGILTRTLETTVFYVYEHKIEFDIFDSSIQDISGGAYRVAHEEYLFSNLVNIHLISSKKILRLMEHPRSKLGRRIVMRRGVYPSSISIINSLAKQESEDNLLVIHVCAEQVGDIELGKFGRSDSSKFQTWIFKSSSVNSVEKVMDTISNSSNNLFPNTKVKF